MFFGEVAKKLQKKVWNALVNALVISPTYKRDTLPKFNMAPEKLPNPNRKGSSSKHHFSGV